MSQTDSSPPQQQSATLVHICASYRNVYFACLCRRSPSALLVLVGDGELGAQEPLYPTRCRNNIHVLLHESGKTGWAVPQESE